MITLATSALALHTFSPSLRLSGDFRSAAVNATITVWLDSLFCQTIEGHEEGYSRWCTETFARFLLRSPCVFPNNSLLFRQRALGGCG